MKKLYKLLLICLLILSGGMALKAQTYNDSDSEYANRAEVPTYISKIAVAYGAKESTPKDILKDNGFTVIDYDLNKGCGGTTHYIYMGYKTTQNPSEAITGIFFRTGENPPASATFDGVTAYLLGGNGESNPGENTYVDLNADAGGSYIYTYVTRDASRAAVLQGLYFDGSNSASGYVTPNVNLNSGTNGGAIYLHYKQFSGKASATFHYLNSSGSRTSSTTSVSVKHHQQAVNNTPSAPTSVTYDGRTWTLLGWREDNTATTAGSTPSYTYMDSKVYRAVYSANVSLTYNANGGSGVPSTQNATQYINAGSSSIAKSNASITIPATIPTHDATKCNFAGWNTSSSATTAQYQPGNNISINTNTILYAVWPEHNGTKTYFNIGENHVYTWSCCGKSMTEDHIYDDGIDCDLCDGYPATLVDGYYQINNANELLWFAAYVNYIDKTASAKLMNDIEMNAVQWTPIGTDAAYNGTFDGQGYTINNLWHNTGVADGGREGLFTLIGSNGVVKNIVLNNATIWGGSSYGFNSCGGIAIKNQGTISNCIIAGSTIQFGNYAHFGGIAGHNTGTIKNCAVRNSILRRRWGGVNNRNIGGITQTNNGTVTDCYSYDNIYEYGLTTCAISAEGNAPINSYQYTTSTVADAAETAKTKAQFASGEVAYLLQGEQTTQVWGQNIDNEETAQQYPVFSNAKVYKHTFNGVTLYSNHEKLAAGGKCGDNLFWNVNNNNTLTIYGTGAMYDYEWHENEGDISPWRNLNTAPTSLVLEEGITYIGEHAFFNCSSFKGSLTIPNSVTTIGEYAFYKCKGFTGSLTIGNSVTSIGNYAFDDCSGFTGSLTIGNSVTSIGKYAFENCSGFTGSLTIGNSVTTIGNYAFYSCKGFTGDLTIPNSVTSIGNYAFYKCSGFKGSLTIPNSVTSIGNSAFSSCSGFTGDLTIPNSVTTIGNYAFSSCSGFTGDLTIPNSVTAIEGYAFSGCSGFNGSLTIPNSVTTIGNSAFSSCYGFTGSLTIPNSVTTIGDRAFNGCSGFTGSLTIPNSVTTIGKYAFQNCSGFTEVHSSAVIAPTLGTDAFANINKNAILCYPVSSYQSYDENGWFNYFPYEANGKCGDNLYWRVNDNILTIFGTGAMEDYDNIDNKAPWRNLETPPTSLVMEDGITHIGNYAFHLCFGFKGSLTIPNSVTTIGDWAFDECIGFTGSLTIPNSVTTIGDRAFFKCSGFNGSLTIGNSVTTIGYRAFFKCSGFNGSLTIPNSVTTIGNEAFYDCEGFTGSLTIPNSVTSIGDWAFADCRGFTGSLTIPNSVTTIGNYAFRNCSGFNGSLTIPNSVTSIGNYAFYDCEGFTGSLTIGNSVTTIGDYAFQNCSGFKGSLTIPNSVTSIGNYAFYDCDGFTGDLTIGNSVTTIGDYAFYECLGFNGSLTIPNSVTTIGNSAFQNCLGFNGSLTIPNSVTTIGNSAFQNCSGFNGSLTIPNSVTSIGNEAFQYCSDFTGSLTIGNSVTSIGNKAFEDCEGFTEVYSFAETAPTLGTSVFSGISSDATLYYLTSSEQSYNDKGWFNYFPQHIGLFGGKCGDNLYWYVDDENTLTISGTGAMYDYDYYGSNISPWKNLGTAPTSLLLEEGITTIGANAFYYCEGFTGDLTIPNSVTTIGNYAFYNCYGFTGSLTIGNSVTTIENYAFYNCNGFTGSLTIGNSVTTIGEGTFTYCSRFTGDLTIPNSITSIGESAFKYCDGFTGSLTIGNSVTTIGVSAFKYCSGLTGSLTIPNSVTSIGNEAFYDCEGFTDTLTIGNSVTNIGEYAFRGCSSFTEVHSSAAIAPTLGVSVFSKPNNATLYYPASSEQSYEKEGWFDYFPQHNGFNGKCGDNLYWNVDDTNTLTIFGTGAMYDYDNIDNKAPWRSLNPAPTSLFLGKGITHIGNYAFQYCNGFTEVYTSAESAPTLGTSAFTGINNNAILYYPASSEPSYDDKGWFNYFSQHIEFNGQCGDNLYWHVDDENTLTIFGTGAMYNYGDSSNKAPWRSLNPAPTSLVLEEGITTIGSYAFYNCYGFTGDLTIPNSVTTIGNYAFAYCSSFTGSLTIPISVTTIGNSAFNSCSGFTGPLTIPNSVTTIGNSAFAFCRGFTGSLTIPNSVTTIGNYAFQICNGFSDVYSFAVTAPTLGTGAFKNTNENATLYYPSLSEQSYDENGWFDYFPQHIGFNGRCGDNLYWRVNDNILTIFGTGAMYDYGSDNNKAPWRSLNPAPTSLVLEEGITHIGNSAFCNCYGFKGSLTIPNSVTSIGNYAFYACFFTGSLTIPNSVTTIGNEAFRGCSGFTGSLTIPNSVTSIGDYAFYNCYGFTGDLTIGNSVRAIGDYAFWACYGFTGSLTIPNSVTTIGERAFQFCDGFTGSLTISNSVTTIGNSAFQECSGFTGSLTIPNSVTTIGNNAFQKCSGFTEIFFYRDTKPTIGLDAFYYINANAKVYAPVIWESFSNIPSGNLVKMATFVREQSAVSGQQSGWVFPEGMTEVSADDHVAINAPMVISGQQSAVSGQQSVANSLSVKSFGYCGNGTTVNGSITIEDGGQLYCEIANGEVTVKKEILGYQQSAVSGQQSESESKWYTIASPLKDTIQIIPNSSFLTSNSDLYRYDEPSYTWQNAKNSANNGFNTIDPSRGYLYANAENTTLEFTGDINTETATYNLTAKSDVLNGFHLIGNPFTHDIYLGESIKTKETQNIIFELNDSYGDGWNGNALNLSFSDETPDKIITMESGNSETETISVATGVTITVSFMKGDYQEECSFTIKYDDETVICDEYSNEESLEDVENGATLTTFTVKEGKDILVNGYYTLTGEGAWAAEASTTEAIKPMQGILVKSLVDDYELKIYNTSRQPSAVSRQRSGKGQQTTDNGQQSLCISVSNAKYSDRAFVVFDKGVGLDKMNHENENIPLLYIPTEEADYAIAMMDMNVNEIPVSFETKVMGEYTISLRQENCEFDELYLLDKETDEKVNILEQDYTFIATSNDAPERFVLLMNTNGQEPTANSHFAYINNGDIVIYNIEGDADIRIFDALGRCVYHGESSDETTRIANGYSSGVYMIQKADDNGVNVQKIIL